MIFKTIIFLTICTLSLTSFIPPSTQNLWKNRHELNIDDDPDFYNSLPLLFLMEPSDHNQDFENEEMTIIMHHRPEIIPNNNINTITRYRRQSGGNQNQNSNDHQKGSVSVGVERTQRGGTDLNAEATAKLWQSNNRRTSLDGNAFYQRHYGGQMGTGRPNYGGGITFSHRF